MNDVIEENRNAAVPPVPTVSQIARMEDRIFDDLGAVRRARRARRGAVWAGVGAAAAVIVVAGFVGQGMTQTPTAASGQAEMGGGSFSDSGALPGVADPARDAAEPGAVTGGGASDTGGAVASGDRQVAATGTTTVVVGDPAAAIAAGTTIGEDAGGYVESSSTGSAVPMTDTSVPAPAGDTAWLLLRIPADQLASVMSQVAEMGEVTASSVTRTDVTDQVVDLQAQVDAAQTSVTRLTELMAQAGSVADLLTAEQALSQRQAELESAQQQLTMVQGQVTMSSLQITFTQQAPPATAEPAGFVDGLVTGWNGLVVTANAVVVGLGFLLPWLVIAAVAAVIVWAVRRAVIRRRADRGAANPPA